MTVNKVGRPSKASERRAAIFEAMKVVAARDGLAGVTVAEVAKVAGLQRTLVFHYFRDRAALLGAFIDAVVAEYGDQQVLGGGDVEARVVQAFETGFYRQPEDLQVWQELVALAARDCGIGQRMTALWQQRWLPQMAEALAVAFPTAPRPRVEAVAYALAALVEGHWSLYAQGLRQERSSGFGVEAALLLVSSLAEGR